MDNQESMESWKEAASLIVAANSSSTSSQTFRLLMTKRSAKSSFLASAFVFPGGHLEPSDFSDKWWSVFESADFSQSHVKSIVKRINGDRPPIIVNCQTRSQVNNPLPSDIGLRICAIRETFEETGVLIVTQSSSSSSNILLNPQETDKWRAKVRENSAMFIDFCLEFKVAPNIWQLYEWWNWLTPNALGHKRFDTMFYLYCPNTQPEANSDEKEVASIEWYTPRELLDLHKDNKAFLAPPQVYELSRLSNFETFQSLVEFAINREPKGVQRWRPLMLGYQDGTALMLPGDDMYSPDNSGASENRNIRTMPTLSDARSQVNKLNRIEFKVPVFRAYCNIKLNCGQIAPLTYLHSKPVLSSSL